MKKLFISLLIGTMIFSLVGCSGIDTVTRNNRDNKESTSQKEESKKDKKDKNDKNDKNDKKDKEYGNISRYDGIFTKGYTFKPNHGMVLEAGSNYCNVTYTTEDDEKFSTYNVLTEKMEYVDYYVTFVDEVSEMEEVTEYEQATIYKDLYIYLNANKELTSFELVTFTYSEDDTEEHFGILFSPYGISKLVEIDETKVDELLANVEKNVTLKSATKQDLWKGHTDAYYEITDSSPKGDIIIVDRYTNWAWGFQCSGSFIDEYGNIYEFDFSNHDFDADREEYGYSSFDEAFFEALYYEVYYKNAPYATAEDDDIEKLLELIPEVDRDAKWEEEFTAFDAGQSSTYIVDGYDMLRIYTEGDCTGELKDYTAQEIMDLLY